MKNQIITMLLGAMLITASIQVQAQTKDKVWSLGPELGVNFSKFGMDADETDYNTGLLAGAFLTYSIRNTHAFTIKVLYSQKGAADEDNDVKTHMNYIEVPIVARLFFNRDGAIRPNIFAGPSFGFLHSVKIKEDGGDYENVSNLDDSYNSFDLGLGLGLGLNVKVAEEMYFILDARYTYGLTDFAKSSADVNNQTVAISAGLSIGISNNK
jgi:hypothetical protein